MINDNCPCHGCEDRNITCHDDCEKYLTWKSEHDKQREQIKKERALNRDITNLRIGSIQKVRKNKR